MEALAAGDRAIYHRAASKWLTRDLPPAFGAYIRDRLERYDRIMADADRRHAIRPFARFVQIWNQGLFFEAHEYLETIWQRASGAEHRALKGLIKAAGVYVHLENNNPAAARRLAPKAFRQMSDHAGCLGFIANLDVLLDCIQRVAPQPPRLTFAETFPNTSKSADGRRSRRNI